MKPITPDSAAKLLAEMERQISAFRCAATAARRLGEFGSAEWRTKKRDEAKDAELQIAHIRVAMRELNRRERVTA